MEALSCMQCICPQEPILEKHSNQHHLASALDISFAQGHSKEDCFSRLPSLPRNLSAPNLENTQSDITRVMLQTSIFDRMISTGPKQLRAVMNGSPTTTCAIWETRKEEKY